MARTPLRIYPTPEAAQAIPPVPDAARYDDVVDAARAMIDLATGPTPEMTITGQQLLNDARMMEYRMQMAENINRAYNPTFTGVIRTRDDPLGQRQNEVPRHCNVVERDGRWIGLYLGYPLSNMPTSLSSSDREALLRGLAHFSSEWECAVDHLDSAGLEGEELRAPMAVLQSRLAAKADATIKQCEAHYAADRKAKALLVMCLNNAQRQEFEEHERFAIEVKHDLKDFPAGKFQISKAASFNVMHVESQERFCVTAVDCPVYDQMLTQKLLLEQDPETFFKTANRDLDPMFRPYYVHRNNDAIYFTQVADPAIWRGIEPPQVPREPAEFNRAWTRNTATLDERYPGWRDTIASAEFQQWLRRLPPNWRRMGESLDPGDVREVLRRYEVHQLREATMTRARANRGDTIRFRRPLPFFTRVEGL